MSGLFDRQVRRAYGDAPPTGAAWERLRAMVESAYVAADDHRRMVEHSLTVMSEELHQRNEELSRRVKSLREQASVLENLHDAALRVGPDGRIAECYAAASQLFGMATDDLVGRRLLDLARPVSPNDTEHEIRGALARTGRWHGDACFHRPDGSEGILAATLIVVPASHRARGHLLAVAEDVTERRRMDRQLQQAQKLDSIGQLAAGIAHEINTPAQYVTDNLQFLQDAFGTLRQACTAPLGDDAEAVADEIVPAIQQSLDGMQRIAAIVRGIKLFAHPGSGEKSAIDLNREIEATIAVSRNEWKYVADLEARLAPDLPMPPGYPGEIGSVVLNLIVNAAHAIADATQNGSTRRGNITVTTAVVDGHAEVRVTDDGGGIPAEIRSKVFDPFFTTKAVGKGTGQGLAICHRIVHEKHGGTIHFESVPGEGTTFIVRLPLAPATDTTTMGTAMEAEAA